jgi:hypothetical protein
MRKAEIFDAWARRSSVWAPWAKPVLFAHLPTVIAAPESIAPEPLPHAPPASARTAIVLDLPGARAIPFALDLAHAGYQPVPLYNAVPGPSAGSEVVDVRPILGALAAAAPVMRTLFIVPDAPPAFLLDANRSHGTADPSPGRFDNRSVSLLTDFPSASFLQAHGIARVLLVRDQSPVLPPDLAHTLLRYEQAGILITAMSLETGNPPAPIRIRRPPWFRWSFQRFLATLGLRRHPLGGFGGTLPEPGSGG